MIDFNFIDVYVEFDCPNSLTKEKAQVIITPKSVKLKCLTCTKEYNYRVYLVR